MSILSFVGGVILTFVFVGLTAIGFWGRDSLLCRDNDEKKRE